MAKGEHLSLDSEGGAQVTTPRTRYLTSAISVALPSSSMTDHDRDAGIRGADGGDVGPMVGAFADSRVVASGFGFYGAAMSVYSDFLARGRDLNYPKDMSMLIGLGTREPSPASHAFAEGVGLTSEPPW